MHGIVDTRPSVLNGLPADLTQQVAAALREDVGAGDVTANLVPEAQRAHARLITREDAVLCGRPWATETFRQLDPAVALDWRAQDGDALKAGGVIFEASGPARAILTGERTAINFLQTLSATATEARRYADAIAGTRCSILDTRKTIPGLRLAQKYAVLCGGARNHRMGLHDMILIKENHIATAGSVSAAIAAARASAAGVKIEIEVENLTEFEEALVAGPDIILVDEFSLADMRTAVARNRASARPVEIEASGGVSLQTVRAIAETGVDFISVGAITKSVKAIDLSLRVEFG